MCTVQCSHNPFNSTFSIRCYRLSITAAQSLKDPFQNVLLKGFNNSSKIKHTQNSNMYRTFAKLQSIREEKAKSKHTNTLTRMHYAVELFKFIRHLKIFAQRQCNIEIEIVSKSLKTFKGSKGFNGLLFFLLFFSFINGSSMSTITFQVLSKQQPSHSYVS